MSVQPHIFLGPYAEIHAKRVPFVQDTCTKPSLCPRPETGFCSLCGKSALDRLRKSTTHHPDLHQGLDQNIFELINEENKEDHTIFRLGPNQHRGCSRKFTWSTYNGNGPTTIISPTLISDEMRWFQTSFKVELEQLRALQFPVFEIRWGQIIYWY